MNDPSEAHPEPVKFKVARTPFEARLVAAVLRDAGVTVFIEGESLVDEFAMSQRLMNLQGVTLKVPSDQLEQATAALDAAKAVGDALSEESEDAANPGDGEGAGS